MDTAQVILIHKIPAAVDERNLPLWIGGNQVIDVRLGRVARKYNDIDLTFPGERRGESEAIVKMLSGRVMEELNYGFLTEIGDGLLNCEPAWWADEAYEITEIPQGSHPEAAEGIIVGRLIRCNSWKAIIWDHFYYADGVSPVDWPTKHIESYRLARTSLGTEKVEVLRTAFRSRYTVQQFVQADAASRHGLTQVLSIMREAMITGVSTQLSEVVGVIECHLGPALLTIHLYGSVVDGGLKSYSDTDLLVTVTIRPDETTRRVLVNDLLETSAPPEENETLRTVEVTIVMHDDIIPWRYPAKRELQSGERQRNDIPAGIFELTTVDIDLAILLTKAREYSAALIGPAAEELFDSVPEQDLFEALNETLTLWNSPPDWAGDERNVVLTLSRI